MTHRGFTAFTMRRNGTPDREIQSAVKSVTTKYDHGLLAKNMEQIKIMVHKIFARGSILWRNEFPG